VLNTPGNNIDLHPDIRPTPTPAEGGSEEVCLFQRQPSEMEVTLDRVAQSIHARHPQARRDCGVTVVRKKLKAILKHMPTPAAEGVQYLESIDQMHMRMCASEQWTKDGGVFAKGLENWLAPTMERYEAEPAKPARTEPVRLLA